MLAGLGEEAEFEFSCEKWRVTVVCRSAACGVVRGASGLEL